MTTFDRYSSAIARYTAADFAEESASKTDLLISTSADKKVRTYYAPFDHINRNAKLVIVGITPGRTQMNNALAAACRALQSGKSTGEALAMAKSYGSFSGKMQATLVKLLDFYGFHTRFGLHSSLEFWKGANHLVHFTSALRNPVFCFDGTKEDNYTGSNPALPTYQGFKSALTQLRDELMSIENGLVLPLGEKVKTVIQQMVTNGDLPLHRVLSHAGKVAEFPHPSGTNKETQKLALYTEMPGKDDYAVMMLQDYRAKRAKEGKTVPADAQRRYINTRHSYWSRMFHSRAALQALA